MALKGKQRERGERTPFFPLIKVGGRAAGDPAISPLEAFKRRRAPRDEIRFLSLSLRLLQVSRGLEPVAPTAQKKREVMKIATTVAPLVSLSLPPYI